MGHMVDKQTPADRLEAALEMWEDGVQLMRENLQRRWPHASLAQLEAAVDAWLRERPGDADGVVVPWPRRR